VATKMSRHSIVADAPLCLDLRLEGKWEPILVVFLLWLTPEAAGSEAYTKIQSRADDINKMHGGAGRISASLQPMGFGHMSTKELLKEVEWPTDRSRGCTHCFTVLADSPSSLRLLVQSKTFEDWKAAYRPHLVQAALPTEVAFSLPLELEATSAAPRPQKGSFVKP